MQATFKPGKKKLSLEKVRIRADKQQHEKALHKFLDACLSRNLQGLVALLRQDVILYADGGGHARAVPKPVYGREKVLKLLLGGMEKTAPFVRSAFITINGLGCGAFYLRDEGSIADLLITIDTDEDGKISNIYFMANPNKLKYLNRE